MIISFKSKSPYFEKERDGLKCNTVRQLDFDDIRYEDLMQIIQTKEEATIIITNPQTQEKFERKITDVTYYDERFIISWKYQGYEKQNISPQEEIDGQVYPNAPKYRCIGCGKIHQDNDYNAKDGDKLI